MSSNLNSRSKGKDSHPSASKRDLDSNVSSKASISAQTAAAGGQGETDKTNQKQKNQKREPAESNSNSAASSDHSDSLTPLDVGRGAKDSVSTKSVSKEKEKSVGVQSSDGPRQSSSNSKASRAALGQGGAPTGGDSIRNESVENASRNVSSGSASSSKNEETSKRAKSPSTTSSAQQNESDSNQNTSSSNTNPQGSSSRAWSTSSSSNASATLVEKTPTTPTSSTPSSNAPAPASTATSSASQDLHPTNSNRDNHTTQPLQPHTAGASGYPPNTTPQGLPPQSLDLPFQSYQGSTSRSPSLPPVSMAASPVQFNPVTPSSYSSASSSSGGLSPALIAALATSANSPHGAAEAVAEAVALQQAMGASVEPMYPFYAGAQGVGIAGRAASLPGGGSVGGGSPSSLASNGGSNGNGGRGRAHSGYNSNLMAGSLEGVAHNLNLNPGYASHRSPQMRASFSSHQSPSYHNNYSNGLGGSGHSSSNHSHSHNSNPNSNHPHPNSSNSNSYVPHHPPQFSGTHYHPPNYDRYTSELTSCIIAFLSPILPTEEEYRIKEATRRQLERLAGKVSPGAKLLAFGSMANGFALKNSDMDLCCLLSKDPPSSNGKGKEKSNEEGKDQDSSKPPPSASPAPETRAASELVDILGQIIREETDFNVMPLPKARIPIIKISRPPTNELPYEIACDIGFENRLALENTRLLLSYAMVDPPRLRTLVLFLKVWTKRRKLNSPYTGTLSSYGYTLMVLFFLTQVKKPPVLPNLQRVPPTRPLAPEEVELNGHNIYFYDDVATLRKEWSSQNAENVGELLIDFFRYFSKEFSYSKDVISIRTEGGVLPKDGRQWTAELCIEDPFQLGYNVSRTVTKDGLYTIRGEFMRAVRILLGKNGRVSAALAELCEEREDIITRAPDTSTRVPRYAQPSNSYFGADSRSYRDIYDIPRRYDGGNASGLAGSFAFEEMARGLGQVQRNLVSYPPTAAMLAPLSQNNGLSPRNSRGRIRAGKPAGGYYQGGRGSSQQSHSRGVPMSSTRSESGDVTTEQAFDVVHADPQPSTGVSASSARSSPSFSPAVPQGIPHSNGVGEAFAFGSEISFGSESFRLHPHSPSVNATLSPSSNGTEVGTARTTRSFSETLNRSKSLPRQRGSSQNQGEMTPRRSSQKNQGFRSASNASHDEEEASNDSAVGPDGSSTTNYPRFSQGSSSSSPGATQTLGGGGGGYPPPQSYANYPQQYPYPEYYPGQRIMPTQSQSQSGRQSPTSLESNQFALQQMYQQYPAPHYSYQAPWNTLPLAYGINGMASYGQTGASAGGHGRGGAASVRSLPNGAYQPGMQGVSQYGEGPPSSSGGQLDSDQEPFQLDDEGDEADGFSSPSEGTLDELARISNQEDDRPQSKDRDPDSIGKGGDENDETISQIEMPRFKQREKTDVSTPRASGNDFAEKLALDQEANGKGKHIAPSQESKVREEES